MEIKKNLELTLKRYRIEVSHVDTSDGFEKEETILLIDENGACLLLDDIIGKYVWYETDLKIKD